MRSLLCRWRWIWSLIQTPLLVNCDPHASVQLVLLLVVEEMVELLLLLVHSWSNWCFWSWQCSPNLRSLLAVCLGEVVAVLDSAVPSAECDCDCDRAGRL